MALRAITPYIPTAEAGGFTARFGKRTRRSSVYGERLDNGRPDLQLPADRYGTLFKYQHRTGLGVGGLRANFF